MASQYRQAWIKGTRKDGRVILFERHPEHPGGELYISGEQGPVRAALTPNVLDRMRSRDLLEVSEPEGAAAEGSEASPSGDSFSDTAETSQEGPGATEEPKPARTPRAARGA